MSYNKNDDIAWFIRMFASRYIQNDVETIERTKAAERRLLEYISDNQKNTWKIVA